MTDETEPLLDPGAPLSPTPSPLRAALRLLVVAAIGGGLAWGASRFGRFIADDAGMSSQPLTIETFPLLTGGLLGGLLLRIGPAGASRVAPLLAVAFGAAVGLGLATRDVFATALRWPVFFVPATLAATAQRVSRW